MRMLFPFLALGLLACTPAPSPAEEASGEVPADARPITGTYVVTFVNGEPPLIGIEGHDPTVTIDAERIHFQSQCVFDDWTYRRDGESLSTGIWRVEQEMCARGLAPGEEAIMAAIGAADTVRHVPHGIWMSGDGGTVQMRWIPGEEDLASRDIDLTGRWTVQMLDLRDLPVGIEVVADWNGIWWEPGCAGQGISYTIEGDRFDAPEPGNPGMVCDIGFPEELPEIWAAMAAADTVERTQNRGVLISGNGRSVLIAPASGAAQ